MLNRFNFLDKTTKRIFFCGIGGVSMSRLAVLTALNGYTVIGSDASPTEEAIRICRDHGIPIFFSHCEENVDGCDAFVYTAAISVTNPELARARELGIKIYTRSEYLGLLTDEFELSIAVAGTHGKSTVTHMLSEIFNAADRSPTVLAGATSTNETNITDANGKTVIYEACEYNRSFLDFHPKVAVILNIEREHTDTYPTLNDSVNAYFEFARSSKLCILSYDCSACRELGRRLSDFGIQVAYFSLNSEAADVYPINTAQNKGRYTFDICFKGNICVPCALRVIGEHNASNALAAALCAWLCDIPPKAISKGISSFNGINRRFEYIGSLNGADVYDDYAHHPTEIRATLKSASALGYTKIICAFQPHTYSRTYDFFDEFTNAFDMCDEVIFADIYAARERNTYGVTSEQLAQKTQNGKYLSSFSSIAQYLRQRAEKGTLILTMGAGKMNLIARMITQNVR